MTPMDSRWTASALVIFLVPAYAGPPTPSPQGPSQRIDQRVAAQGSYGRTNETPGTKSDFESANRVIFFDDFSETADGEFPSKWTLKGPGGGGNPLSVVSRGGRKFLLSEPVPEGQQQDPSTVYVRMGKLKDLPGKFTIEFDAILGYSRLTTDVKADKRYEIRVGSDGSSTLLLAISSQRAVSRGTQSELGVADGNAHRIAVSVNETAVTAYLDGQRVIDDPDGVDRPVFYVGVELSSEKNAPQDDLMFANFRIAQ